MIRSFTINYFGSTFENGMKCKARLGVAHEPIKGECRNVPSCRRSIHSYAEPTGKIDEEAVQKYCNRIDCAPQQSNSPATKIFTGKG